VRFQVLTAASMMFRAVQPRRQLWTSRYRNVMHHRQYPLDVLCICMFPLHSLLLLYPRFIAIFMWASLNTYCVLFCVLLVVCSLGIICITYRRSHTSTFCQVFISYIPLTSTTCRSCANFRVHSAVGTTHNAPKQCAQHDNTHSNNVKKSN
jgi:hypothetical protein